jgi:hypothetical protein
MENREKKIDDFFAAYEKRFNDFLSGKLPDIDGTANSFAECFVEASPGGVNCGKNNEDFKLAIPKGYEFYKSIGTQSMDIMSKEITLLDDYHAMVKINWRALYIKKNNDKEVIEFSVFYFVQMKDEQIKIFSYITGDEQKVLKERGLI